MSGAFGSASSGGNDGVRGFQISADGSGLLIFSPASDVLSGVIDINFGPELYHHDRSSGVVTLVSRSAFAPIATPAGSLNGFNASDDLGMILIHGTAPDWALGVSPRSPPRREASTDSTPAMTSG